MQNRLSDRGRGGRSLIIDRRPRAIPSLFLNAFFDQASMPFAG
jgi:hypothetical protein